MNVESLSLIALGILLCAFISKRVERLPITLSILFTLFGFLIGPQVLGWVPISFEREPVMLLAELTLVLVLFTDAARIDLQLLIEHHTIPVRTLTVGLFFVLLFGTFTAFAFFSFTIWESAVLAAILTPTDAALGLAVLNNERVPIRIRQAINIESGLNDGLALPLVLILMSTANPDLQMSFQYWTNFIVMQLALGPIVGIIIGLFGGFGLRYFRQLDWMKQSFEELASLALAILAYGCAESVGGNGFGAAFFAGLVLGSLFRDVCPCMWEFAEAEGSLFTLLTFLIFGGAMVPLCWIYISLDVVMYAILSLTVIRMLPILLSLTGTGLRWDTKLFIGWFGPRGIASILFGIIILEHSALPVAEQMMGIISLTVLLSIILHGATAFPFSKWYADRLESSPAEEKAEEVLEVKEAPIRW